MSIMNKNKWARIIVHTTAIPLDRSYTTYEWDGPATGVALLEDRDLDKLPWRLVLIESAPQADGGWYARKDGWLFFNASLLKAEALFGRLTVGIKSRIILTLHVWGVGYTETGGELAWKNLLRKSRWGWW